MSVTRARCRNHPSREAAARCVGCQTHFCAECVTPVDRRMLCASCLEKSTSKPEKKPRDWFLLSTATQLLLGLLVSWFTAYMLGRILLQLPDDFHEATVWERVMDR